MCITSGTPSLFPLGSCAPHLQLSEHSLSRRLLNSTLWNEKIVFSAYRTRETYMDLSEGGKCVYIFRPHCIDITNRLRIASYIRWYLSFREDHLSFVIALPDLQLCPPRWNKEKKRKEIHSLYNHLPFHLWFVSRVPQIFHDHELKVPI